MGREPQSGVEDMNCSPWMEVEGSVCCCVHVIFSAALPDEALAIRSPVLQYVPSIWLA